MRPKKHKTTGSNDLFRARLDQIINMKHELVLLAGKIDWDWIDGEIAPLYSENSRPGIETRFIIGLLFLKHIYGLSDEGGRALGARSVLPCASSLVRICQRNCVEDGSLASRSRPAGAGFKPLQAAAFKRRGGERWGKGGGLRRQVSDEKMSASEPPITHRNGSRRCQNGHGDSDARKSVGDTCLRSTRQPVYGRHDLITGFNPERGNLARGVKGNPQVAHATRENTPIPETGTEQLVVALKWL
ncbi:hypothetical protein ACVWZM_004169 [Bradyrhizobium sp. USDA 4501]